MVLKIFLPGRAGWCGLATRGQPSQHLLGFLAALDFEGAAVLLALAVQIAEVEDELFEGFQIHQVAGEVFGDIGEGVRVNAGLVQIPDSVEGGEAFAKPTTHEGEAGSLDGDLEGADLNVGSLIVGLGIVGVTVDAHMAGKSPFAVVAGGLGFEAGGQVDSFHSF